jgi:hypothetical protein
MRGLTLQPAELTDLAVCLGSVDPLIWQATRHQWEIGPSWALCEGPESPALAVGGLVAEGHGRAEAWFLTTPQACRHLRAIVRFTRLTFRRSPYRLIGVIVGTDAGARLARLCGMTPAAPASAGVTSASAGVTSAVYLWRRSDWAD